MKKRVLLVSVIMMALTACDKDETPLQQEDILNLSGLLSGADTYFYPDSTANGEGNYFTTYSIAPFEFVFFQQISDWGGFLGDSWGGFTYSNIRDNTTPGFMNQFSAITGGGMDGVGSPYLIGFEDLFNGVEPIITFTDKKERILCGGYVTNSTWVYFAIKDGDSFSSPFKAGDWFKVEATGYTASGNPTTSASFYLADFRDGKSVIVNNWQWFDLSGLGKVASVKFTLSSSDVGDWGMNTPAYFCLDKLRAEKK